jgi:dihydrodipicolinate synthase/N-acetylneuraminate lyase
VSQPWRGIFAIVITPFQENGELDEASLRRTVRFCIEGGAHGLVGPANASEFSTLSDDERRRWIEIVVSESGGQIPVVASVTSGHTIPALSLAKHAQGIGADGIMAMPPHILHPDEAGCFDFYQALSSQLDVPICVQNFDGPIGTPMSPDLLVRICNDLKQVEYIKEERTPEPQRISQVIAATGEACKGVMGGQGGVFILNEYPRGIVGTMPGCHTVDVIVKLWDSLEAGDDDRARSTFNGLLPLINHERLYGVSIYKEVMYRRGIITSPTRRAPGQRLDSHDLAELDRILVTTEDLYEI